MHTNGPYITHEFYTKRLDDGRTRCSEIATRETAAGNITIRLRITISQS